MTYLAKATQLVNGRAQVQRQAVRQRAMIDLILLVKGKAAVSSRLAKVKVHIPQTVCPRTSQLTLRGSQETRHQQNLGERRNLSSQVQSIEGEKFYIEHVVTGILFWNSLFAVGIFSFETAFVFAASGMELEIRLSYHCFHILRKYTWFIKYIITIVSVARLSSVSQSVSPHS